jgi:glycine/D-amino acid oxidase-like deaminating enzyme
MRICVIGGGLAGTLLAWRLARQPDIELTVVTGLTRSDATGCSGGLVRRFECDDYNAELATRSLAELRDSPTLRSWSDYREVGSLYIVDGMVPERALAAAGSVTVLDRATVASQFGMRGLPESCSAVWDPAAGYVNPDLLRRSALADLAATGARIVAAPARRHQAELGGGLSYQVDGMPGPADLTVVAAGAWTRELTGADVRTKVIQYGMYEVDGERPPAFVDETSGLYGRPSGPGQVLLGLPTDRWDIDPDRPLFVEAEERKVRTTTAARLPGLRLRELVRCVASVDSYAADGRLRLRPVRTQEPALFTFTGGSGGAAKTALAASADAAVELRARHAETPAA